MKNKRKLKNIKGKRVYKYKNYDPAMKKEKQKQNKRT